MKERIGILGGGAAGFFGAIQIASISKGKSEIAILEKSNEALSKVKISGGGRCNVTHNLFDPVALSEKYPRGSKELRAAFERFQPKDTIEWFKNRGVLLKSEPDGRMFPVSDSSSDIIDCFIRESEYNNIKIYLNTNVTSIYIDKSNKNSGFRLACAGGEEFYFDKLLVASGSNRKVWGWMEALGHTIEKPVPSLFTLNIDDELLKELSGISIPEASIQIYPKGKLQTGAILITHWGLSGPAVLRLSAWEARDFAECDYKTKIRINWAKNMPGEECISILQSLKNNFPSKKILSLNLNFPSRLWEYFIKSSKIHEDKRWSEISKSEMNQLKDRIVSSVYDVNGKGVFKDEFVTCGGIKRKEVDFRTMESKIIPGLFFAGEVLDVDGITGGFNFQNAWTTASIAAQGIWKSH